ncbi:alpha/beta hydrolase [Gordonia sp. PKS22-38]|uniref:Alpha/beta hydrolase n=1 Tax=Gordonia prachuapensis TaxID=3115651 RepID=A0ABU7MVM4_9ACTN|nr:alpha/beta hydrolase [Gordonia sp. PKS22-38]
MDLTAIDRWNTAALDTMADTLGSRVTTVGEVEGALRTAAQLPGWFSEGGDSARSLYTVTADDLRDEAAVLGAAQRLATETSAAVKHLQARLAALRSDAAAESMTINPDGSVVAAPKDGTEEEQAARESKRLTLEASAKALIAQAADVDADAQRVFTQIQAGEISARGAATMEEATRAGADQGGLTPLEPPADAPPREVTAYWEALTPEQQQQVLTDHPDWLGNVDGIPMPVRHTANVSLLDREQKRLEDRRDRLRRQIDDHWFDGTFTNEDAELEHVEKKIADVEKLRQIIDADPWSPDNLGGKMLVLMDMQSGEQGKAAIAIGNPDDADHISVTTPGVDTTIHGSFDSMMGESENMRDEVLDELQREGRGGQTVSTISWLGFEPPVSDGSRPPGWYLGEAAQQDRASDGADDLADFYRGLAATSTKDDPHIVALGHSYGSVTQGLALQEPGGHPVDDAVFYGSPGFEANDEPELGLEQDHGYVMQGDDDWIRHTQSKGPIGTNGPAPNETDLVQLDVDARTTPDGVDREGAYEHPDYPRNGANGELRVSGYLMARIIAGLPPE